jgi:DNA repair exonuclease SbcCD ATPase subunit
LPNEKELQREEKEKLREERKAQQEMDRERARLEKERQHYRNALEALRAKGDEDAISRHEAELEKIQRAIEDVDYRAANIRAGYVYVISNIGSFGEGVVKIGLTRRLEPQDRVRELGDASVPFRFDTHALLFSKDAVGIEASLHQRLANHRVNRVNTRREFFYATPEEVKAHLLDVAGELLSFEEDPEALEYHQSRNLAEVESGPGVPATET